MIDQCGIAEHAEDCLCDVVITKITPVNVRSVSELWGGDAICNIFDLAGPWEPDNLLEFFEKLLYGYDMNAGSRTSIRNVRPRIMERSGTESFPSFWNRIRVAIEDIYHESPDANITEVLEMLNLTVEEFRDSIMLRRVRPDWDTSTLVEMQRDARDSIGKNKFARKYGLNPDRGRSGDRIYDMLGGTCRVDRHPGGPGAKPTTQQMQVEQYVVDNPDSSRDMITHWHRQQFPDCPKSTRSKQISRAIQKARGT